MTHPGTPQVSACLRTKTPTKNNRRNNNTTQTKAKGEQGHNHHAGQTRGGISRGKRGRDSQAQFETHPLGLG